MKNVKLLILLVTTTLAACGAPGAPAQPAPPVATAAPVTAPTAAPTAAPTGQWPHAALAARQTLAQQLGLDPAAITIVSADAVEWPNSCLGVVKPGEMCADVITPGYKVVLEAQGKKYEVHTSENGASVRIAPAPGSSAPDTSDAVVITWHREGGIAGFCDDLTVYGNGTVVAASCKGNQSKELGRKDLTADQLKQLVAWVNTLKSFQSDQTDPAVADAMTIRMSFTGAGTTSPTDADRMAIGNWAASLLNEFH